jgi:hypothetical protein
VADTARRGAQPGDQIVRLQTQTGALPGALVLRGVGFGPGDAPLVLRGGREETVEEESVAPRPPAPRPPSPTSLSAADRQRRADLARVARVLRAEAARAARGPGSLPVSESMNRYRAALADQVPFRGDYRTFYARLSARAARREFAAAVSASELAALAAAAEQARLSIRPRAATPAPPPPRQAVTRLTVVNRPLPTALVVIPVRDKGPASHGLRPPGPGDNGTFFYVRLTRPVRVDGRTVDRLLSARPLRMAPPRALPLVLLTPDGATRLSLGDYPALSGGEAALLLPHSYVRVPLVTAASLRSVEQSAATRAARTTSGP